MGEVWAALDTTLERPVAIKVIHRALAGEARYAERFLRETKLVARVAHPNIVRLYDAGATANGRLFMVMERVFGVSLRQMMAGGARLDGVRALHYAIQIADALATAHEAELVHRDVKPENVLVSDGVHARLLDFGVAKDARGAGGGPGVGLTRQGAAVGTSRYMAPEQITGSSAVDARADLYALGVVLYEMLAGVHPYAELDAGSAIGETEILAAHVHLEARPLPEVLPGCPEALWQAVATCLAKRPEERFARAGELAEALRAVAQRMLSAGMTPGRAAASALGREAARAGAMAPAVSAGMALGLPAEEASARRLLSEAADAARARAIRGSALPGAPREEAAVQQRELLRGPAAGEGLASAPERDRLAMAQLFEVAPAWGLGVASAGEGSGRNGDATTPGLPRLPPVLPVEGAATRVVAAGQRAGAGAGAAGDGVELEAEAGTLASTETWERPTAATMEPGTLMSTEKWAEAAAVMAAMAGGERLARTEPWNGAGAGVAIVATSAASSRARQRLIVVGVLVLGLAALLAAAVAELSWQ
jgi:serine/threonine-protein kinase